MAATVNVYEWNGATGAPTSASMASTTARFCTADTSSPGTSYPLVRPNDTSTSSSFWKSFALVAETSAGGLNNVKWYTDGSPNWTGCTLKVGTTASYVQATGTTGSFGTSSTIASAQASGYTSGAKLSVSGSYTSGTTSARFSDFVVMQVNVTSAANPGTQAAETITWEYDET